MLALPISWTCLSRAFQVDRSVRRMQEGVGTELSRKKAEKAGFYRMAGFKNKRAPRKTGGPWNLIWMTGRLGGLFLWCRRCGAHRCFGGFGYLLGRLAERVVGLVGSGQCGLDCGDGYI